MSILQRQLRVFLAAFLVAGLLLAGIATAQATAAPCSDRDHHSTAAASAQVEQLESSDVNAEAGQDLAPCCSTAATSCCASAAIILDDAIELNWPPVGSAWLTAAASTPHGLGDAVNRRPPRLA